MEDNTSTAAAEASTTFFFPPRPPECGNFEDVAAFQYWFDGVLVSVIAVVGFVGNLLALIVLSRDLFGSSVSLKIMTNQMAKLPPRRGGLN